MTGETSVSRGKGEKAQESRVGKEEANAFEEIRLLFRPQATIRKNVGTQRCHGWGLIELVNL